MQSSSPMTELETSIRSLFAEVFAVQNAGAALPALSGETVLLETGLDSLGFAILVTRLEEELGYDPFTLATEAFYPRTLREFVEFYAAHAPK